MNHFSELLATNFQIQIRLRLIPVIENGAPLVTVIVNSHVLYDNALNKQHILTYNVDLLDPIIVRIELHNKIYSETKETAVIIDSLTFDGIDMLPNWTHLATYVNDHANNNPTSYLGFNGVWSLTIDQAFYRWHHRITGQGLLLQ